LITQRSRYRYYRMRALLVAVVGAAVFAAAAARRTSRGEAEGGCGLAEDEEYPWQAAVVRTWEKATAKKTFVKSGILINDRYVLTTPWNFDQYAGKGSLYVILGANGVQFSSGDKHKVSEVKRHPGLENGWVVKRLRDAALLLLETPVLTTPVCLPPAGQLYEGVNAITTGWSSNLQEKVLKVNRNYPRVDSEVAVLSNDACAGELGAFAKRLVMSDNLCARHNAQGVCYDGGNPLITKEGDRYVLIGMPTSDQWCNFPEKPDVYTRVTELLPWIADKTADTL